MSNIRHLETASLDTLESGMRVLHELRRGTFKEHILTDDGQAAHPIREASYQAGFERFLKSRNFLAVLDCSASLTY